MSEPKRQLDCICDSPRCQRSVLIYDGEIAVKVGRTIKTVIIPESITDVILTALDSLDNEQEQDNA